MKIKGHILAVIDDGEHIKVEAQGAEVAASVGSSMKRFEFFVRTIDVNRRALYVGRALIIEIKPGKR